VVRLAAFVVVVALLSGCAGPQAHRLRKRSELAIGGSLIGVMLSSAGIAALPDQKRVFIGISIGFGALAVASAITYGIAYAYEEPPAPPPPPPTPPDHRADAWKLTQQAQTAARAADCEAVLLLAELVSDLDHSFYDAVFVRDVAIARCLADRPRRR
jgi:hypothetical protein